jgi:Aerobic-type carbon monoxide dehydrogenase, middle subunit CoxM/CutM homologs
LKPPSFGYHRPLTVADALAALAESGSDAKVLAGGQSLIPLLNMRLAAPKVLVDINRLGGELDRIEVDDQAVRIGALVRHARLLRPGSPAAALPLLAEATRNVAHPTIRNRGTAVGSLVHADPAAELPAVLLLSGGSVELASVHGTRAVPADQFFVGPLQAALAPGELAVAATFPRPPARSGSAFLEVSRRAGDYALVGVALQVRLDGDGRVASARAAYLSVGPTPVLVDLTDAVTGSTVDWEDAGRLAQSQVEPDDDIHASAAYRRHLVGVLTRRAGQVALARAREASGDA